MPVVRFAPALPRADHWRMERYTVAGSSVQLSQLHFRRITQADVDQIAHQWRYPEPYAFYNADADPDDLAELLDPAQWPEIFEAWVTDVKLLGFYSASLRDGDAEIGLGLAPEITGRGIGAEFVEKIVERLVQLRPGLVSVSLSVAAFNERATKVYQRAGFRIQGTHRQETNGGFFQFVDMVRNLRQ